MGSKYTVQGKRAREIIYRYDTNSLIKALYKLYTLKLTNNMVYKELLIR